jgi:hypothetical protein
VLEVYTRGGFLQNIVAYNINPFALRHAFWVFRPDWTSLPFMLLMLVAAPAVLGSILPSVWRRPLGAFREIGALRYAERPIVCRAMLLVQFILATLMLMASFKQGAYFNYLIEWLVVGSVLVGLLLIHLDRNTTWNGWAFPAAVVVLAVPVLLQPLRYMPIMVNMSFVGELEVLVQRIAASDKPVAADNMALLMRAGKPVWYEPAIVTELALLGKWNETPLVDMIRSHGFAFILTDDNDSGGNHRRTPAVDAAMRAAYPHEEKHGLMWLHLPS